MYRKVAILALILIGLLAMVVNSSTMSRHEEAIMVTHEARSWAGKKPAPEFMTGLDWLNTDRPLTIEELKGKVVVLDFWTYGCINCIHIIPDLKRLEEEFAEELVVIGVHSAKFQNEGVTDNIRQIILRYELEHPVVNDRDFMVWRSWGARAWPTLVIIDPSGNVVGGHSGEGIYPLFQPIIESLVHEFDEKGILDRTPIGFRLEKEGLPETVLSFPGKVLADGDRNRLFIADSNHNRIVVAASDTGEVLNVIGNGEFDNINGDFATAAFAHPQGMALSDDGMMLYIADTENHALRRVDLATEEVTTIAGTGVQSPFYPPRAGEGITIALNSPWDLELEGDSLYIAMAGSHQLWVMDLSTGHVKPFVGSGREGTKDGLRAVAELAQPSGLALDGMGRLYFADSEGSSIRWAETGEGGFTGTLAGNGKDNLFDFGDMDGFGRKALLQHALGVVFHDGEVFIADTYNSKIKRIDPKTMEVKTFLGSGHGWRDGADPLFYEPGGMDVSNGKLYVADTNNHSIRVIDLGSGQTETMVLKGIEHFMASADEEFFGGIVVTLDPMTVGVGSGKVLLEINIPNGYKVNDLAPYSMEWKIDGDVIVLAPDANRSIVEPMFPLEIDATFKEGKGMLTGDLNIFYCEAEKQSICLIEQVRLQAPLMVSGAGADTLKLSHAIELPEIVTQSQ